MTERLYYDDAYLWTFDAAVTAVKNGTRPGEWKVTLDRSAFYPTSGGQPFDTGTLAFGKVKARVTEVEADSDGEVWHTVDKEIPAGTAVHGEIDGERRTDHMEQHGGEHMLAGAIWEKLGGTEDTVNARIRLDAPIRCWFPEKEELKKLPLRKAPTVSEHVRIVAMGDFEMVACGGTHPSSTGRIGSIKIISAIPAKGKVRVSFVCGGRAAKLFQTYMHYADKAGAALSSPVESGNTEDLKGITLCTLQIPETDGRAVNAAVSEYISGKGRALLLCAGERLTFARSADVNIDMNALIKRVGRGGGRPDMASGAGVPECIGVARKILMTEGVS